MTTRIIINPIYKNYLPSKSDVICNYCMFSYCALLFLLINCVYASQELWKLNLQNIEKIVVLPPLIDVKVR